MSLLESEISGGAISAVVIVLIVVALLNVVFAVICGNISNGKGHGFGIGFVLGFFLGFFGLLICVVLNDQSFNAGLMHQRRRPQAEKCGQCGANITRQMNVCPMCSTPIAWQQAPQQQPRAVTLPDRSRHPFKRDLDTREGYR